MTTSSVTASPSSGAIRATAGHAQQESPEFPEFMVGQTINIKVQQRLDEQHYVALMRGERRRVYSERPLPVGEPIAAVVLKVGDKLELRQVPVDATSVGVMTSSQSVTHPVDYSDMRSVARFYRCDFTPAELATLQKAVDQAPNAEQVVLAGLILNKRGLTVQPELLDALCAIQSGTGRIADIAARLDMATVNGVSPTVAGLAQLMRQVLQDGPGTTQVSADKPDSFADNDVATEADVLQQADPEAVVLSQSHPQNSNADEQPQHRILQLLNDVDSESMGVRYGTLPVLIDGRLVELELVLFQHRPRDAVVEPIRRLVMSIHTNTLGTVQIAAEALNNRLMIKISGESVEHTEALAVYVDEVSELVKKFGWALDSVGYEVRTQGGRLAQRVIEHGVRQGVIDNVW